MSGGRRGGRSENRAPQVPRGSSRQGQSAESRTIRWDARETATRYCGNGFEPTNRIGASAIVPPKDIPGGGKASVAKGICEAWKAFRTSAVSGDGESGIHRPKATVPAIVT